MVTFINKSKCDTKYRHLECGDWFLYQDRIYIKMKDIRTVKSTYQALDVKSGSTHQFSGDEEVKSLNVNIEYRWS